MKTKDVLTVISERLDRIRILQLVEQIAKLEIKELEAKEPLSLDEKYLLEQYIQELEIIENRKKIDG